MAAVTAALFAPGAGPVGADTQPTGGQPATVSADGLPTAQMDGVAWAQLVVGDTVYVTGSFAKARPAGVALGGTGTVSRANLLAYNIKTGALTSFNHTLNGQGLALAVSPDNATLYVGGDFTTVDGAAHAHIAAFSVATGGLKTSFTASANNEVRALAAGANAVYAGGSFSSMNGVARARLAAVNPSSGAVLAWNPGANALVRAVTLVAGSNILVAGGHFTTLGGATELGMGAVDATSGAIRPWAANTVITDSGNDSAIFSLTNDGSQVYGTGYFYTTGGNFEGRFAADPATGNLVWLNNCHGDSYDVAVIGPVLYSVSHEHDCSDISSFSQDNPSPISATRHTADAETTAANGGVDRHPLYRGGAPGPTYHDFAGEPTSTQLDWYPTLTGGTYTGQGQAAWSLAGNSSYLAVGGEFPTVNGVKQQGLVRFAVRSIAPNKVGPTAATSLTPVVVSQHPGTARVSWQATWDEDNTALAYAVYRDSGASPVYTTTLDSTFWNRPALGFVDKGLAAGSTHTYKVVATDPFGNARTSGTASVTIGSADDSAYAAMAVADGATHLWPLGETSGAAGYDHAGYADLTLAGGYSRSASGPVPGSRSTAFTGGETTPPPNPQGPPSPPVPNDTAGTVATAAAASLPTFTEEAWFRTTSSAGGAILDDGLYPAGDSGAIDRVLYLDSSGHVRFGVQNNATLQSIASPGTYADGTWHLVDGVFGASGGTLYVDGSAVAHDASMVDNIIFPGHWRVAGDSLANWPAAPSSNYLAGSVAEAAVYGGALAAAAIASHYAASGNGGGPVNQPPTAVFTDSCAALSCSFDGSQSSDSDGSIAQYSWNFGDGSTGAGATANHAYATGGDYTATLTVTDNDNATDSVSHVVTVSSGGTPPQTTYASDAFNRTVASGFGTADVGGSWTSAGKTSALSVKPGGGRIALPVNSSANAYLGAVSAASLDLSATVASSLRASGTGSAAIYLAVRRISSTEEYFARLRFTTAGTVLLTLVKYDGSTSDKALSADVNIGTYTAGQAFRIRIEASGTGSTSLLARAWPATGSEPTTWQASATDSSTALQSAGSVGVTAYVPSTLTNAPVFTVSQLQAVSLP